jgi:hypothetical protein
LNKVDQVLNLKIINNILSYQAYVNIMPKLRALPSARAVRRIFFPKKDAAAIANAAKPAGQVCYR